MGRAHARAQRATDRVLLLPRRCGEIMRDRCSGFSARRSVDWIVWNILVNGRRLHDDCSLIELLWSGGKEKIGRGGGCEEKSRGTCDSEPVAKPRRQSIIGGAVREAHQEGTTTA